MSNAYIHNIYIYFRESARVVNADTTYSLDLLKTALANTAEITNEQFASLFSLGDTSAFQPFLLGPRGVESKRAIVYSLELPIAARGNRRARLIMVLNQDLFLHGATDMVDLDESGVLSIHDANGDVVASSRQILSATEAYLTSVGVATDFKPKSGRQLVDGTEYAISFIRSRVNDWAYVYTVPASQFLTRVDQLKNLMIIYTIGVLSFGLLVAALFARMNYRPIRSILYRLQSPRTTGQAQSDAFGSDEYTAIIQAIERNYQEKTRMLAILERQDFAMRCVEARRILRARHQPRITAADVFGAVSDWLSQRFCVLLFYIDEMGPGLVTPGQDQDNDLIDFIIENVVSEIIGRTHQSITFDMDGLLTCLVMESI